MGKTLLHCPRHIKRARQYSRNPSGGLRAICPYAGRAEPVFMHLSMCLLTIVSLKRPPMYPAVSELTFLSNKNQSFCPHAYIIYSD